VEIKRHHYLRKSAFSEIPPTTPSFSATC
jgi:hypothetical protein